MELAVSGVDVVSVLVLLGFDSEEEDWLLFFERVFDWFSACFFDWFFISVLLLCFDGEGDEFMYAGLWLVVFSKPEQTFELEPRADGVWRFSGVFMLPGEEIDGGRAALKH